MSHELINVIDQIGREKSIDKKILIEVVKTAILSASKKKLHLKDCEIESELNEQTGDIEIFILKKVVKKPENYAEISLEEAKKINPDMKINDSIRVLHETGDLGRISAHSARQVIVQKVREAERNSIFNDYQKMIGRWVGGTVVRFEKNDIIIDLGKTEGILPRREQVYREKFKRGDRLRLYLVDVKKISKGPMVILSRAHPDLLTRLFEMEVPEIGEGIIEIKNAVRETDGRSKIAVFSNEKDIDAVGSCVGIRGIRVQAVVQELKGEKIDIVEWSENASQYVANALKPAKISKVNISPLSKTVEVVVPKDQLSLAIGKSGQNVRLAARLTGWKIDIKNEDDLKKEAESKLNFDLNNDSKIKPKTKTLNLDEIEGLEDFLPLLEKNGLTTVEKVLAEGKNGLMVDITSLGEDEAEIIINLVNSYLSKKKHQSNEEVDK